MEGTLINKPTVRLRPGTKQYHCKVLWKENGKVQEANFFGTTKQEVQDNVNTFIDKIKNEIF